MLVQNSTTYTSPPTTRAAITQPIHNSRLSFPSGVMPFGQPRPMASDQLQPLSRSAVPPRSTDNATNRNLRAVTLVPPRSGFCRRILRSVDHTGGQERSDRGMSRRAGAKRPGNVTEGRSEAAGECHGGQERSDRGMTRRAGAKRPGNVTRVTEGAGLGTPDHSAYWPRVRTAGLPA